MRHWKNSEKNRKNGKKWKKNGRKMGWDGLGWGGRERSKGIDGKKKKEIKMIEGERERR